MTSSTSPVTGVPLIDLKAQHDALGPALEQALLEVAASGQFILGPYVERFEKELAAYCEIEHAVAVSSGTDALLMALMALDIGAGDEVITTPFSFFATAGVISRVGATPVFVDIDPATFNLDPRLLRAAITPRTRAIMPVHLFGLSADMDAIAAIACEHELPVIEDAAQAIGARLQGRMACSMGRMGCLSFYPTKNLAGMGEGGAVLTGDGALAARLRCLRNHGMDKTYEHTLIGGNFRMQGFQGAVLSLKLARLNAYTDARRAHAARYGAALADLQLVLPGEPAGYRHVYNQYTLRIGGGQREALMAHLQAAGIGCRVYYPAPLHRQPCYEALNLAPGCLPHAEQAAQEVLSIPVYPELSAAQQDYVVDGLRAFFTRRGT